MPNVILQVVRGNEYFLGKESQFEIATGDEIPDTLVWVAAVEDQNSQAKAVVSAATKLFKRIQGRGPRPQRRGLTGPDSGGTTAMEERAAAMSQRWRKSSYSANGGAECIEAGQIPGAILVRDTTRRDVGPVLRVTPADWTRLLRTVAATVSGEY
jgi:Domain of unknown function (DUF397)